MLGTVIHVVEETASSVSSLSSVKAASSFGNRVSSRFVPVKVWPDVIR
jgi:hypothetical protein